MKCPVDAADLLITERSGVEIDYCPQCRGVWLDRGELDKIIDRVSGDSRAPLYALPSADDPQGRGRDHHGRDRDQHGRSGRRKREGFLGELFDL